MRRTGLGKARFAVFRRPWDGIARQGETQGPAKDAGPKAAPRRKQRSGGRPAGGERGRRGGGGKEPRKEPGRKAARRHRQRLDRADRRTDPPGAAVGGAHTTTLGGRDTNQQGPQAAQNPSRRAGTEATAKGNAWRLPRRSAGPGPFAGGQNRTLRSGACLSKSDVLRKVAAPIHADTLKKPATFCKTRRAFAQPGRLRRAGGAVTRAYMRPVPIIAGVGPATSQ